MKKSLIKATFALAVSAMVFISCEKENFEQDKQEVSIAELSHNEATVKELASKNGSNSRVRVFDQFGDQFIRYDGLSRRERDEVLDREKRLFGNHINYFSLAKCPTGRIVPNNVNVIFFYKYDYINNGKKRYAFKAWRHDTRTESNLVCRFDGDD